MSEHDEQKKVFRWARSMEGFCPSLRMLFAVPNAARRSKHLAAMMLAEGMKSGVPDIWYPVPNRKYIGLVMELKFGKNKLIESQKWWLDALAAAGWKTEVPYSGEEAIEFLKSFIDWKGF